MKKLLLFIVGLTFFYGGGYYLAPKAVAPSSPTLGAFGDPFISLQLATSPANGECLTTDGTNNDWATCGGGSAFPFTPTTNFAQGAVSTSTQMWFQGSPISLSASSTAVFTYASSTALTVTGTSYLGTIASGIWNGTTIAVANGGTGLTTFGGTNTVLYTTAANTLSSETAFTYDSSLDRLTVVNASTTSLTAVTASTTNLSVDLSFLTVATKRLYARWRDRMSIPSATSTDETVKFGACLESGGPSVTIDKINTLIASTSADAVYTTNSKGIAWNLNIAANTNTTSPMTAFTTAQYSQGTSSIQSFTPNSVVTIPSGYCYWFAPSLASTTQIQMFYFEVYGYEN